MYKVDKTNLAAYDHVSSNILQKMATCTIWFADYLALVASFISTRSGCIANSIPLTSIDEFVPN